MGVCCIRDAAIARIAATEIVEGLHGNVSGNRGQVTGDKKNYLEVVIPAIENSLKRNAKLRLYCELGAQFTGIDLGVEW